MRPSLFLILCVLAVGALAAGCSAGTDAPLIQQVVVQGYLYANEPLDSVVLRHTLVMTDTGTDDRVHGATVTITTGDTTTRLTEIGRGVYRPERTLVPRPGQVYTLHADWGTAHVTATTSVPTAIRIDSAVAEGHALSLTGMDSVTYPARISSLSSPGIHLYWSTVGSGSATGAAGYALEALAPRTATDTIIDDLTRSLADSNAYGRYRFFVRSMNESVAWIQFTYFGENTLRVLALDQNYQDLVLATYLSGSQFNNNSLHITGGLGVFASAARASMRVYVR